ncbi:MAG: hypothetical protein LBQ74_20165 [Prevotella sp.]|nr:hypothetical protein [Prevotella sp.]
MFIPTCCINKGLVMEANYSIFTFNLNIFFIKTYAGSLSTIARFFAIE